MGRNFIKTIPSWKWGKQGGVLSPVLFTVYLDNLNDLFMRTNNLMADFSFTHSRTLSVLYNSYCMNAYDSQLWCFNDHKSINRFYVAWRKTIRRIWHIDKRTQNSLLPTIDNCLPIDLLLEKRCIAFIWN